ncbi:MAG: hypothetical protein PHF24_05460 [Syntrophomonas sp.]|nr:hypothetical protein [Syntrophomonas sp.]
MSEDGNKDSTTNKEEIYFPDLIELWKEFYFKNENSWSEVIKDYISQDTFVSMLDKTLDHYLNNEKIMRQNMDKYFERSAFPSKKDIARIAEMVIAVEEKVEVLDYQFVTAFNKMADSMLSMADSQKKISAGIDLMRQDIAIMNTKIEQLEKKTIPAKNTTKKSAPSKTKKKDAGSESELNL